MRWSVGSLVVSVMVITIVPLKTLHRITIERCNIVVPERHRGMDLEPMNHFPGLSDIPPLRTAYPLGRPLQPA